MKYDIRIFECNILLIRFMECNWSGKANNTILLYLNHFVNAISEDRTISYVCMFHRNKSFWNGYISEVISSYICHENDVLIVDIKMGE